MDIMLPLLIVVSCVIAVVINHCREKTIVHDATKTGKEHQTPPTPTTKYMVTSVALVKKREGVILGVIGVVLTIALWLGYLVTCEITVLQAQMINFYTLTAMAALVSFFGLCFGDSSSRLLAGVALVGAFLLDYGAVLGLIPAILLMVSSAKMKHNVSLKVKREKLEDTTTEATK